MFEDRGETTHLKWHMLFQSKEEFIQTVKTFKADEGLRQNLEKLEVYIKTQKQLHANLKPNSMARVATYLNFNGNTEAAFNFYKSVFKTEFVGGMKRFGDIPADVDHPPMTDEVKKMIIHVELPILGGHLLMATDAPESLGFKLNSGNNMHINLEPESREETKRLFEELTAGGTVTMELQDMFFGSYYGSGTDKFGINWMFNFVEKKTDIWIQ
jgi:PhnB protein